MTIYLIIVKLSDSKHNRLNRRLYLNTKFNSPAKNYLTH